MLRVIHGRSEHDVVVGCDHEHTCGELADALADHAGDGPGRVPGLRVVRTGRRLAPADLLADADVVSGDEILLGVGDLTEPDPDPDPAASDECAMTIDVVAGPESGRSLALTAGRHRIGRRADCDLVLDDASVSRHHADVVYAADGRVTIRPVPGTANGVTVNDEPIGAEADCARSAPVGPDDVIGLGGTRLALRAIVRAVHDHVDRLGQVEFHRTPYRPPIVRERPDRVIGPIPERPEPRRMQTLAVLAPLAGGLTMYAFSRQPQFLALTAVSPLVMVANLIEDRRSGRRRFRDQLAAFRSDLGDHRVALAAARHDERLDRLRAAPDLAELSRRAVLRTVDLWARGRDAPDFLWLRVGLGTAPVSYGLAPDRGGDAALREEVVRVIDEFDDIDNVPVVVDLTADPVLGVHGERALVDGVATSLLIQAATLHSPEDLTIAAAIADDRPFGWVKWLPHVRTVASPLAGSHLVTSAEAATALAVRLVEVAGFRSAAARDDDRRCWPRVLLILDGSLRPDPVAVSRLLDVGPTSGISVIWIAPTAADIPRQAARVLDVRRGEGAAMVARLWSIDPRVTDRLVEVDHLRSSHADRVARALAPVRDASTASLATSIPRTAPLLDVLGVGRATSSWITEQWLAAADHGLRFAIGLSAEGPLVLDLVEHGPHSLIGGTSGSGKSELLQGMVAALAARNPPTRLNFLFVDYKGGASSKVFERLPHTVGYVTNLAGALSTRALVSLRAELDRRMRAMEGVAKDLAEMLTHAPDLAPPSLVIVVDEFATLVQEVPEFVAGVVDIAQRGRSLGIHLVLATQRPSGSVNENILANTNLRISLRMLDRAESTSVIDGPEAADIPVPLRGRGFVRLGPRRLVEFQSSFAGAPLVSETDAVAPVVVVPFERPDDSARRIADPGEPVAVAETHLSVLLDAIGEASRRLDHAPSRRPWRDVLDPVVHLDAIAPVRDDSPPCEQPGRFVTCGLLDLPESQEQRPAMIDLEAGGGLLVVGSGGAGKTTLLRTVATSVARSATGPDDVAIVGLDFASRGLASIAPLPDVVDVATGDDLEAVTRHLSMLEADLTRRRRLLADAGAEDLTAFRRSGRSLPRVVVLIDGFGGLASTFLDGTGPAGPAMERWGDIVQRLVVDGRQVGIHTVIAADRIAAVPARIQSAISNRLVLRHADPAGYADHGISSDRIRDLDLPAGRGLLQGTTLMQVATVAQDPTAAGQAAAILTIAERLARPRTGTLTSRRLPERVALTDLTGVGGGEHAAAIGVADVSGAAVVVDVGHSHLVVCGPPRSGRSTALATVVRSLASSHEITAVGGATSPLGSFDLGPAVAVATGGADALVEVLGRLTDRVPTGAPARPRILVVDDADLYDDPRLLAVLDRFALSEHVRVVASVEARSLSGYSQSALLVALRRARRMLVLGPDDPHEFLTTTGVKLMLRPGTALPAGRGVLLVDRVLTVVQVADPT